MIKRISPKNRQELRKNKKDKNKLDKLIKVLIAKGTITQEDLK